MIIRRSRSATRTAVSACWTAPAAPPVYLFFGRNEECGLRCVYHGWKFEVEGNVMHMPAEPSNSPRREEVKIKSYPMTEWGGVIWAYLGDPAFMPEKPPELEIFATTMASTATCQAARAAAFDGHACSGHRHTRLRVLVSRRTIEAYCNNLRFTNMTDQTVELQTKRIVGVLASPEALQKVIDSLELKGFDHAQFGVLSTKADDHLSSASAAAADPLTPTEAPDDPESTSTIAAAVVGGLTYLGAMTALGATVLTGGGLGLALVAMAAAGGVGGVSGLLVAAGFQHEHAESIDSQLSTGGLILWIKPRDPTQQAQAVRAMQEAGATDVKDID